MRLAIQPHAGPLCSADGAWGHGDPRAPASPCPTPEPTGFILQPWDTPEGGGSPTARWGAIPSSGLFLTQKPSSLGKPTVHRLPLFSLAPRQGPCPAGPGNLRWETLPRPPPSQGPQNHGGPPLGIQGTDRAQHPGAKSTDPGHGLPPTLMRTPEESMGWGAQLGAQPPPPTREVPALPTPSPQPESS